MSDAAQRKQEADLSNEVDAIEPAVRSEAKAGRLTGALEQLGALEKQARNAADLNSTTRLLLLSLLLIRETPSTADTNWTLLCETAVSLSKKHGQLKSAIARMVRLAMAFLKPASEQQVEDVKMDEDTKEAKKDAKEEAKEEVKEDDNSKPKKTGLPVTREEEIDRQGQEDPKITELMNEGKLIGDAGLDAANRLKLVETLRTITEGKIFVEVERARVTKMLVDILREKGEINEAADTLQEVAVETFGSMERREKVEFILNQMRLNYERGDFARMNIVSRKINTRFFEDKDQHDLKLDYYQQMVLYAVHEKKYLDVCKYCREIYNTPSVQNDAAKAAEALRNVVVFLVLSPYNNEQSDLMARVEAREDLDKVPEHRYVALPSEPGHAYANTHTCASVHAQVRDAVLTHPRCWLGTTGICSSVSRHPS